MMIKAIIFDLDGVIVKEAERYHYASWKKFCKKHDFLLNKKIYSQYVGRSPSEIISRISNKKLSKKEMDLLISEKNDLYLSISLEKLKPSKGIISLFKNLQKKYRLALATSCTKGLASKVIAKIGLGDFFSAVITSSDIKNGKPNPEIFLKAARQLKCAPEKCLVIEDSVHGIEAANRGGMKSIAIASTHSRKELFAADYIVDDLFEIRRIL